MEEEVIQPVKRGRGRPRKNPGDPSTPRRTQRKNSANPLTDDHEYFQFLPNRELEVSEENLQRFFETMYERQMIWKRRFIDKSLAPWTNDEIFQTNKFPNLYRELDRSSWWLISNIIMNPELSLKNKVWKCIVYRLFNSPDFFEFLSTVTDWEGGIPDYEKFAEQQPKFITIAKTLQNMGAKPFTDAYIISSSFVANTGKNRAEAYADNALSELWASIDLIIDTVLIAESTRDIIDVLVTIPGVQKFIANELMQDMIYINRFSKEDFIPFNVNELTNVGPGSLLGLRIIFPNRVINSQRVSGMRELLAMAKEKLNEVAEQAGEPMVYAKYDPDKKGYVPTHEFNLTLNNIEGWLCEYSKYWKIAMKVGKMQRKFKPVSSPDTYDGTSTENASTEESASTEENTTEDLM